MKNELTNIADEVYNRYKQLPKDFDGHVLVGKGASGSSTSKIDKFAEDAILEYLEDQKISLNVLSEEVGYVDRGAERTLVVDPIDGTLNCTRGIPFFSVSLAIAKNKLTDCEFGLVKNLYSGDTYFARRGGGAELNGHRIGVSKYNRDDSIFIVFDGVDSAPETGKVIKRTSRIRSMGCASLEMCLVAQGAVQAHYMNCTNVSRMIRIMTINPTPPLGK